MSVTLQSWAGVISLNKAPLSQISSFAIWNAAELLLTQDHSTNTSHWAPTNDSQTMAWSSLETGLLSSPVLTQACAVLHVRGEQTHLAPRALRDKGIHKDLSAVRISSSCPEHPQLLHYKCYLPSLSSPICLVPNTHPAQLDEIPQFQS